jgi:hypothetical protein
MPENHPSDTIAALERKLLRTLCHAAIASADWDQLVSELTVYHWQDPDHKVVYEALRAIKSRDPKTRRDVLPAQATRMGFPDVDWRLYFERDEGPEPDLQTLFRRLKATTLDR